MLHHIRLPPVVAHTSFSEYASRVEIVFKSSCSPKKMRAPRIAGVFRKNFQMNLGTNFSTSPNFGTEQ